MRVLATEPLALTTGPPRFGLTALTTGPPALTAGFRFIDFLAGSTGFGAALPARCTTGFISLFLNTNEKCFSGVTIEVAGVLFVGGVLFSGAATGVGLGAACKGAVAETETIEEFDTGGSRAGDV